MSFLLAFTICLIHWISPYDDAHLAGAHITGKSQRLFPGLFADFNGFSIGAVFRNLLASRTNRRYSIFLSLPGLVIGIRLTIRANVLELNIIRTAAVNDKFGL